MLAKDIKRGAIVNYNGAPCIIESVSVQSPSARGAATFYKYRGRNLITKQKVDITLRGGEGLDDVDRLDLGQREPVGAVLDEIAVDAHLLLVDAESTNAGLSVWVTRNLKDCFSAAQGVSVHVV